MTPILYLAITVAAPIIVAVILRVNAAVLFMSLCVGEVLVLFVAGDASSFTGVMSPVGNIGNNSIKLALLLVPPALTTIFMFHTITGVAKVALNVIPAIGVGLLMALLVEPLLASNERNILQHSTIWHQLTNAQTLVVSLGALFSLVFLWLGRHGGDKKHHGRGSHHH